MPKLRVALSTPLLVWFALGCCSLGRYPSDIKAGVHVRRDELVEGWRVNGRNVCAKEIVAVPACYVLEVAYGASYDKYNGKHSLGETLVVPPTLLEIAREEQTTHNEYHSDLVPFALRLESRASYYVTATFTGDEFLPRIIVLDAAGKRLRQIDPARSPAELRACANGKPSAVAPKQQTAAICRLH